MIYILKLWDDAEARQLVTSQKGMWGLTAAVEMRGSRVFALWELSFVSQH